VAIERTALADLIRRARRRQALHVGLRGLATGAAILLGGLALLVVTGSAVFGWELWTLLGAVAIAAAGWQMREGIGPAYLTAQKIDRRLRLNDILSTAWHFSETSGEVVELQRAEAESAARRVDLKQAFPFATPRAWHACWSLALVAGGLFFVRYGLLKKLDLSAPLVHLGFDGGDTAAARQAERNKLLAQARSKRDPGAGDLAAPWQTNALDNQPAPDNVLDAVGEPDVENSGAVKDASTSSKAGEMRNEVKGETQGDGSAKGDPGAPSEGDQAAEDGKQGGQPQQDGQSGKQGDSQNQSKDAKSSPGLMDRMRDAMTDLLQKLKPSPQSNENKQASSQSRQSSQGAQQQAGSKANQAANNAQQGAQDPNAQGEAGAQPGEKMEASRGRGADNSSRNDSPDSKSGVGSQDGDKEARYADQLAAMGKISELIGKRSANITGEVMVEVASGKQQLKTQYTNQKAGHTGSGGEVDRDEVPLAYQQYVQQYFEQIRKQPATAPAHAGTGAAQ
jgi:hypothetical protein